ncbi:hypothetical protein CDL15_Pgr023934 [Punica granatum]|uniref:Uncharacterized protein n=1 Tax=Punica granatum TaxID=22663 RepID=A0A218XWC5_PUNGR|nr:hypothetical protein CDL15_Pgr023934 [Punica granatum]
MQGAKEMQDAEEMQEAEEMPEHWKEIYRETPKMNSLAIRKVLEVMNDIETAVSEMKKRDNEEASRSNSDGKEEASGEEYSPEEERTATEGA